MSERPEDEPDPVAAVKTTLGELACDDLIEGFYGLVAVTMTVRAASGWVSISYLGDDESGVLHAPAGAETRRVRRPDEAVSDGPGSAV